jgi:hypothetical protein
VEPQVILVKEFLGREKTTPMPHLECLVIFLSQDPFIIPTMRRSHEFVGQMISFNMVSMTSQEDKKPCSRGVGRVGLKE